MARMFTNSIYYVHEKSGMAELNEGVPVSQPKSTKHRPFHHSTSYWPYFSIHLVQADEPEVFQGTGLQRCTNEKAWHWTTSRKYERAGIRFGEKSQRNRCAHRSFTRRTANWGRAGKDDSILWHLEHDCSCVCDRSIFWNHLKKKIELQMKNTKLQWKRWVSPIIWIFVALFIDTLCQNL